MAIGVVGWRIYRVWTEVPWSLPSGHAARHGAPLQSDPVQVAVSSPPSTDTIVAKNLFDPERGAGAKLQPEANLQAMQRIQGMVLLGTVNFGNSRAAVLQVPGSASAGSGPAQGATLMRVTTGDIVEGFRVTAITDNRVVLAKGASRAEIELNYFRSADLPPTSVSGAVGAQVPAVSRTVPMLPRRERLPVQPERKSEERAMAQ